MRTYHQLTQAQRYQIYALKKTKHSLAEIATVIGVHKSSVSRELKRNRGRCGYRPQQAQELALERRHKAVLESLPKSGPSWSDWRDRIGVPNKSLAD